jgi:hypothetical protein
MYNGKFTQSTLIYPVIFVPYYLYTGIVGYYTVLGILHLISVRCCIFLLLGENFFPRTLRLYQLSKWFFKQFRLPDH